MTGSVRDNVARVRERIGRAAARSGRRPEEVRLVAVTKTVPLERILEAREAGLAVFGENYVQEAEPKVRALPDAEWHFIGSLQRNKAGRAVELFSWIQTVDSPRLLAEIARRAARAGKVVPVLVEVNVGGETSKGGVDPAELPGILSAASGLPGVRVRGLMAIPPFADDPEESRSHFARLRELLASLRGGAAEMSELSMGMSNDFEVAIEEGATMIRVGTALFGIRP